jgi:hypothetical protein
LVASCPTASSNSSRGKRRGGVREHLAALIGEHVQVHDRHQVEHPRGGIRDTTSGDPSDLCRVAAALTAGLPVVSGSACR